MVAKRPAQARGRQQRARHCSPGRGQPMLTYPSHWEPPAWHPKMFLPVSPEPNAAASRHACEHPVVGAACSGLDSLRTYRFTSSGTDAETSDETVCFEAKTADVVFAVSPLVPGQEVAIATRRFRLNDRMSNGVEINCLVVVWLMRMFTSIPNVPGSCRRITFHCGDQSILNQNSHLATNAFSIFPHLTNKQSPVCLDTPSSRSLPPKHRFNWNALRFKPLLGNPGGRNLSKIFHNVRHSAASLLRPTVPISSDSGRARTLADQSHGQHLHPSGRRPRIGGLTPIPRRVSKDTTRSEQVLKKPRGKFWNHKRCQKNNATERIFSSTLPKNL